MKKLTSILLILTMLLTLCVPAFAEASDQGAVSIPFRFASKEEGKELLLSNKEYYDTFTPAKLAYVMQRNDATMEEYYQFAGEQVLEYTDREKDLITRGLKKIETIFAENGWTLPPLDTIVFIKTSMAEENNVDGYTHGTQIYLLDFDSVFPPEFFESEEIPEYILFLLAHELFHCLTRCNPDFRAEMYRIINFTVVEEDYKLPPSVWEVYVSNPDVEHHNSWAAFEVDGKKIDGFAAFVLTKPFEKAGERFIDFGSTAIVPIDGSDVYYLKDQVSNFDEVFGTNTAYVIDPEECMADNFANVVLYGMAGPEGNGYPNPEIVEGVIGILSGK